METIKNLVETKKFLHKWVNISLKSTNIQKVFLKVENVSPPSAGANNYGKFLILDMT